MTKNQFIDALGDADVRWKVHQAKAKTLDEALTIAVEVEKFFSADKQRDLNAREVNASCYGSRTSSETDLKRSGVYNNFWRGARFEKFPTRVSLNRVT